MKAFKCNDSKRFRSNKSLVRCTFALVLYKRHRFQFETRWPKQSHQVKWCPILRALLTPMFFWRCESFSAMTSWSFYKEEWNSERRKQNACQNATRSFTVSLHGRLWKKHEIFVWEHTITLPFSSHRCFKTGSGLGQNVPESWESWPPRFRRQARTLRTWGVFLCTGSKVFLDKWGNIGAFPLGTVGI